MSEITKKLLRYVSYIFLSQIVVIIVIVVSLVLSKEWDRDISIEFCPSCQTNLVWNEAKIGYYCTRCKRTFRTKEDLEQYE